MPGVENSDHYLDGFILFGGSGSEECREAMRLNLNLFERIRVPMAAGKTEDLSTSINRKVLRKDCLLLLLF